MLFLTKLHQICTSHPHKIALEFLHDDAPEIVTYSQLEAHVQQTMRFLIAQGIRPKDRVALQLPKCLPFFYLYLAIMRLGAITLPLNPAYPERELRYFLENSGAALFFVDAARGVVSAETPTTISLDCTTSQPFHALIATAPTIPLPHLPTDPDTTALMIYTSGTTGRPKGAEISHRSLTANLDGLHTAWGWRADDIMLHVLPIFHYHGLIVALHGALHAGATAILLPKFKAVQTLELLLERQCSVLMAVPTIHRRLLAAPNATQFDLSHMRLITSGSDRLPDDMFKAFQTTFGQTLLERYGMTETGLTLSNPLHGERRVGSVGLPLPMVEAQIADPLTNAVLPDGMVGEVQIRGPHLFKGYWGMAVKSAESLTPDGWLKTGDLGLREADGYYTLKGRAKDLIITGGLNVYPPEVELVLRELPEIAACAVVGCPDAEWGETIVAVVVLGDGVISAEKIIAHCRRQLASYKIPRRIQFVDALPANALGKVQKARVRERLCQ